MNNEYELIGDIISKRDEEFIETIYTRDKKISDNFLGFIRKNNHSLNSFKNCEQTNNKSSKTSLTDNNWKNITQLPSVKVKPIILCSTSLLYPAYN